MHSYWNLLGTTTATAAGPDTIAGDAMAFWLTLLYLILTYLSPTELIPSLAPYRPELILAIGAVVTSSFSALSGRTCLIRARQTYLLLGLIMAVLLSELVHLWLGGLLFSFSRFMPSAIVFFLLVINVNSWGRLRIVVAAVLVCAFALLAQALWAYYHYNGVENLFIFQQLIEVGGKVVATVPRIQAVGALNDPNDFAQFLLITVPLLGLLWKTGSLERNLLVIIFTALIIYGIFLTHSRGGLVAFIILLLIVLRRRVGRIASAFVTAGAFMIGIALNFTGGRGISVEAGMDRLDIWSDGLSLFKDSPLFGVGFGQFTEYTVHTAHNSFLLCVSELGLFGFFFWAGLVVVTVLELTHLVQTAQETEAGLGHVMSTAVASFSSSRADFPVEFDDAPHSQATVPAAQPVGPDVRRWALALRLCLLAFIATGWFLSRTYAITLYLIVGLAVAFRGLAEEQCVMTSSDARDRNWVVITLIVMLCAIVLIYLSVHTRALA